MKKLILITLLTVGMLNLAFAATRDITTREHPWVMRSVAALGMGDAYYTKSDDKYAPFYNPAGLARIKKGKIDLMPITVGVNHNMVDFYSDFNDIDTDNTSQVAELLADRIGDLEHAEFTFYPGYTRKNFTIGIFAAAQVNAAPWNPATPELNVDLAADAGVVAGIAHGFFDDHLQAGISGRYQQRYSYQHSYDVQDIVAGELDDIKWEDLVENGWGVFFDIGMIYNIFTDGFWMPRVGLAVNNLGMNDMGDAKDLPWSLNFSAGISPHYGIITSDIILDIRDLTKNFDEDDDWGKRINFGAEVRLWERVALRGGIHQGWGTVGAGLDLWILDLNYAYYHEEIGSYAGQKKDTRHALEVVLGF